MIHLNQPLKIIFLGTPKFSADQLKKIILLKYDVKLIITKPDQYHTRLKKKISSPVKKIAKKYNIPIIQPKNLYKKQIYIQLISIQADTMLVIAYGLKIPQFILKIFPIQPINVHASLLPLLRGSSPIQYAILNGSHYTGVSTIHMNNKIDCGHIIHQNSCYINKTENTISLTKKLSKIGTHTIFTTLKKIQQKKYITYPQNKKKATYSYKIKKHTGEITFLNSAKKIEQMTRAFFPWPGTYIMINNTMIKIHKINIIQTKKKHTIGKIIKINPKGIQIQTKKDIINITKIQIPGKKIIKVSEFILSKQKFFIVNKILNTKTI